MGLVVEISIDIKKNNQVTEIKLFLSELAEEFNCESYYYIYETEGVNSKIERNDCIQVVEFNTPQTELEKNNILNFIKKIINKKYTKLDTVYQDNGKVNMIYNSVNQKSDKQKSDKQQAKKRSIENKPIIAIIKEKLGY